MSASGGRVGHQFTLHRGSSPIADPLPRSAWSHRSLPCPCRTCRYYPPGVIFVYEKNGQQLQRTLDLLDFGPGSDVEALLSQIAASEPMVTETKKGHLRKLIYKLLEKQQQPPGGSFSLFKVLRAHILPLTNCAFN